MLTADILARVRQIEIATKRLVNDTFAGEYLSVFKGRGMEFAEVREYSPGDDIRSIDWNVTARTGKLHVRRYSEERELTVLIACDLSASQFFGSAEFLKNEVAAELSALLAFAALRNNDKVGLLLFTEGVERYIPPKKGRRHALHLIRDVLAYKPQKRGTRLDAVLETLQRSLKRRAIVFLISDFRDSVPVRDGGLEPAPPSFERALRLCALKHDLIPVVLSDPLERALPAVSGLIEIEDPETGRRTLSELSPATVRSYRAFEESRRKSLERLFRTARLDCIDIGTEGSYIDPVVRFFQRRMRRIAH